MSDVQAILSKLPAFETFNEKQLRALAKLMQIEEHTSGTAFTTQGEAGKACHLLIEGEVVVSRTDELTGAEEELKVLKAGELFGILSLLEKLPAAATCTARGPVRTASLPRADYKLLFKVAAPIAFHFQWLVAQQLARDLLERNRALRQHLIED